MTSLHFDRLGLAILVVVVAVLVFVLRPVTPTPNAHVTQAHELHDSKPAFTAKQETLTVVETTFVRQAQHAEQSARAARHAADSIAERADSLESLARASADTATLWYAAWRERSAEADSLHRANDSLDVALAAQRAATLAADTRAFLATARLDTAETLTQQLAADVAAKDRCHPLPFVTVPCPSRTTVFVAGAVGGPLLLEAGKALIRSVRP